MEQIDLEVSLNVIANALFKNKSSKARRKVLALHYNNIVQHINNLGSQIIIVKEEKSEQ